MNDGSPRGWLIPRRWIHDRSGFRSAPLARGRVAAAMLAVALACGSLPGRAQGGPTAARIGDLQIGGGFVFAKSGYNFTPIHLVGPSIYTTFDWKTHLGAEFSFHNTTGTQDSTVYERTYEIGPRVFVLRGPFEPYAKAMYGRGVYNFSHNIANVAYNIYTFGGGIDLRVRRSINVRADYEYQSWPGFPLGTLHPSVFTFGVAYHFHE